MCRALSWWSNQIARRLRVVRELRRRCNAALGLDRLFSYVRNMYRIYVCAEA